MPFCVLYSLFSLNRIKHVLDHLYDEAPEWTNKPWTYYKPGTTGKNVVDYIDTAWGKIQSQGIKGTLNDRGYREYVVDMGRKVGANGEMRMTLVFRDGTNSIITAHPTK